jgi:hypothetical protein
MKPVVDFLSQQGLSSADIQKVVTNHPPVLCYSVPQRLGPFFEYLTSIGIEAQTLILRRPSLLGLDAHKNLRIIVDYLLANNYTLDQIKEYLATSI